MLYTLHHGNCLDIMQTLADASVDIVLTDPPYFKVKSDSWDRQWDKPKQFLAWLDKCVEQWARVLKPNGSLYCFASPQMAARVEVLISERMNVLNHIVWAKNHTVGGSIARRVCVDSLRSWMPEQERVIFAEHYGADNIAKGVAGYQTKCDELRGFVFEPLRAYLAGERDRAGIDNATINAAWCAWKGVSSTSQTQKWFSNSCFNPPTAEAYQWLRELFNKGGDEYLRREYEDLRREYEDLRREYEDLRREYEDLRRPFSVCASVPYTDVWTFEPVRAYKGKHPCEKPHNMLVHMITASTKPGAVVLDCFAGTGSTGVACANTGRKFIGIEMDDDYFKIAENRIKGLEDVKD